MTRFWKASPRPSFAGASSLPWACQLIGFDIDAGTMVLDLVALEPRPGNPVEWPCGTPFTVHMALADVSAESVEPVLSAWTQSADLVAITAGEGRGCQWLCFSAQDTKLVAKLVDRRGRTLK